MTRQRALAIAGLVAAGAALAWLLFVGLPRRYGGPATSPKAGGPASAPATPGRKIKARLFFVSEDGTRLTPVERDVPYGEGTVEQARQIVEAQIAPVAEPLVSAIPPGTTLRALFISGKGEAYVDLSRELAAAHSGGSLDELLTIYTLVNALTTNLPAISSVQLLVDGKEVDTLAGHADLRRPLSPGTAWIE